MLCAGLRDGVVFGGGLHDNFVTSGIDVSCRAVPQARRTAAVRGPGWQRQRGQLHRQLLGEHEQQRRLRCAPRAYAL